MNNELYYKLTHIQWLLHKQQIRGYMDRGPMADTTRGQGRILAVLKLQDSISTKDLSYLLGIRISSLNELLAKLEKSGYITREASESDKRVMLIKLTEKGRDAQAPDAADYEYIFGCLSDEEQQSLGEYLDRIIEALTQRLGYDDDQDFERMEKAREHFEETIGSHFDRADFHRNFGGFGRFDRRGFSFGFGNNPEGFDHRGRRDPSDSE